MGNAAQAILTTGILGGLGYVIYKAMQEAGQGAGQGSVQAQPAAFVTTTTTPNGGGLKNGLFAGLGSILQSTGNKGGGLLEGLFGGNTTAPSQGGAAPAASGFSATPKPSRGPVAAVPFGQQPIGARLKRDLMTDFGFTGFQAAGIVGNLHLESAGFIELQEIQPMQWVMGKLVPSSTNRGGFGYAQWTGPRRRAFERWAASHNLDVSSYDANYGFLHYEMTSTGERRVVPKLKATRTVEEATLVFMRMYLRPGIQHAETRINYARRYV